MRAPVLASATEGHPAGSELLSKSQQRVVDWRGPGVRVLLGAPGTGATTAIVHAAAARLAEGSADEVLVIGHDRDSVRRLRAAIARLTDNGPLPVVTTFHGLAYAIVQRSMQDDPDVVLPRLLSGAEEDVRIRDLLRGAIDDGDIAWPAELLAASATLGFANDVRALLARSRELGLDGDQVARIAAKANVPAWECLARFSEIESGVMALEGVIDYTRLLEAAIDAVPGWTQPLRCVYADDFHEAGPLQRELLESLVRRGAAAVVAADPDLSAYAFRGADRLGALALAQRRDAEVIVLDEVHAGGGHIRRAYESVRRQPGLPGLGGDDLRHYRSPRCSADLPASTVEVTAHDSWSDLAAWVADDLMRRHLGLGVDPAPWESMAVIGRSSAHLESLRRALDAVGVPVRIDAADIPLQHEPAAATLLSAVSLALLAEPEPRSAAEFLAGPLVGLDPGDLRALARALRQRQREEHSGSPVASGTELVCAELLRARDGLATAFIPVSTRERVAHDRVWAAGSLLRVIRDRAESGAAPAEVLWDAWAGAIPGDDGLAWPERLRRAALSGHAPSSHDLDAVIALFATAERLSDRYSGVVGIRGLLAALDGQRVPAEKVAHHITGAPAVTLMTAHRAVGRQWDHVVIVGAQEGTWPPFLGGSSVLHLVEWDALARGEDPTDALLRQAAAERLAQERRLFALAVSRARRSLLVATVASDQDEPSRFVHDLGVEATHRRGRPPRSLTLDGLVAELRTIAHDADVSDELRSAAVRRLALLADAVDDVGARLVPRADPDTWWGLADPSPGVEPVRAGDEPIALSGSGLAALAGCPARWFLSRVVHADGPRGRAMAIGSIVHGLAEWSARGSLAPDRDALLAAMDQVWAELPFDAPWEAEAERRDVAEAIERLCAYLTTSSRRTLAVEHRFRVSIPLRTPADPGDTHVVVAGLMDRIEIDDEGGVHVVDFKTGRSLPSGPAVQADPQLAIYQEAVRHGALDDLIPDAHCTGASLVQLRVDAARAPGSPRVQPQDRLDPGSWLHDEMAEAVRRIRAEDFPAVPSGECRTCLYVSACPAQMSGREVGS